MKYKNISKSIFQVQGGEIKPGQIVDIKKDSHKSITVLAKHKEFQCLEEIKEEDEMADLSGKAKPEVKAAEHELIDEAVSEAEEAGEKADAKKKKKK